MTAPVTSSVTAMLNADDLEFNAGVAELMPILSTAPKDLADHIEGRRWMVTMYPKLPKSIQAKRFNPAVSSTIYDVPITYGDNQNFSVRVYEPNLGSETEELRPALIMVHGGGWIHGSPEADDWAAEWFASEIRGPVVSVDYRLVPEHPFPAPHDDVFEALNWTVANAARLSIDSKRIGMWGCSAGGNLAAGVALRDSASGPSRIAFLSLVVPVTCHPHHTPLPVLESTGPIPQGAELSGYLQLWDKFAPGNHDHPYASVLLSSPTTHHPPTVVALAGKDLLFNEGLAHAIHLRNAGIDCQIDIAPGVPHGLTLSHGSHVTQQFFRNQARAIIFALGVTIVKPAKAAQRKLGNGNGVLH